MSLMDESRFFGKIARLYGLKLARHVKADDGMATFPPTLVDDPNAGPPRPTEPMPVTPAKTQVTPIDPKIQQALVNAGYPLGTSGPEHNGVDGKLGELTRKVLEQYKAKNNFQMDDKKLFAYILRNMNTGVSNRQFPEDTKPGTTAPTGAHSTGTSNRGTAPDSAGTNTDVGGPKPR